MLLCGGNNVDLDTMRHGMILQQTSRLYEPDDKGNVSSSSTQDNLAFVSSSNNNSSSTNGAVNNAHASTQGNPQMDLQDQGVIDSGCSRHKIGNMSYLIDYEEIDGGYVAFGGNLKGGKII
ncbi:hypothetical protein Tco_0080548 [Tanacetum coccineum]